MRKEYTPLLTKLFDLWTNSWTAKPNSKSKSTGKLNLLDLVPLLIWYVKTVPKERFEDLLRQEAEKEAEKKIIEGTDPKDMYLSDLETLKKAIQ
mgnify:CR=1 FL=1